MTPQEFLLLSEDEIAQSLGSKAKAIRVEKNITQRDFSTKAGINYETYSKFERTGIISLVGFLKVLRYLGKLKDISELLSLDDVEKLGVKAFVEQKSKKTRQRASVHAKKS